MAFRHHGNRRALTALLASSALMAPAAALAADISATDSDNHAVAPVSQTTDDGLLLGPETDTLLKVDFVGTTTAPTAAPNKENTKLMAIYLDDQDTVIKTEIGASVGVGSTETTATFTNAPVAGQNPSNVIFVAFEAGTGTPDSATNDPFTAGASLKTIAGNQHVGIVYVDDEDTVGIEAFDVGSDISADVAGNAQTIADAVLSGTGTGQADLQANNSTNNFTVVHDYNGYEGPKPVQAGQSQDNNGNTTEVKITFNAPMINGAPGPGQTLGNGTQVAADLLLSGDGTTVSNGQKITVNNGPTAALTGNVVRVDEDGGSFNNAYTTLEFRDKTVLKDAAGNPLAFFDDLDVPQFEKPKYAPDGETAVLSNADADGTANNIETPADLWTSDGTQAANADTFTVAVRFKETMGGTNTVDDADFEVTSGAGLNVDGATLDDDAVNLTLGDDGSNYDYRFNANGVLQYSTDGGSSWSDVQVRAISNDGDKLETAENKTLDSNLTFQTVKAGVTPAVTLRTQDGDSNGVLDGGKYEFGAPLTTPLGGTTGLTVSDDTSDSTANVTASTADGSDYADSVLKATVAESDLEGFLGNNETKEDNLNTGNTGADLPYTVALQDSEITYAAAYDAEDGTKQTLADQGANAPGNDGAGPVLTDATYDSGNGDLTLTFSEGVGDEGSNNLEAIEVGGLPVSLFNVNNGSSTSPTLTVDDDEQSQTIANVAAVGSSTKVNIAEDKDPGITDDANDNGTYDEDNDNPIAAKGDGREIDEVVDRPNMQNAYAVRDANGELNTIFVQYDKAVTLPDEDGVTAEGLFQVRVFKDQEGPLGEDNGKQTENPVTLNVSANDVTVNGEVVELAVPGIKQANIQEIVVDYNHAGTQTGDNRLVSDDDDAFYAVSEPFWADDTINEGIAIDDNDLDRLQEVDAFTGDGDTQVVNGASNTADLYTMTLEGSASGVAEGGVLRAQIVGNANQVTGGTSGQVTHQAFGNRITTQVNIAPGARGPLNRAARAGERRVPMTLVIEFGGNGDASAQLVTQTAAADQSGIPNNDPQVTRVPVTVDMRNGRINGDRVSGNLNLTDSLARMGDPAYVVFDDVDDGSQDYELTVGTNQGVTNGFVMVAYKAPGENWMPLTNGSARLTNYQSFDADVLSGDGGTSTLDLDVDGTQTFTVNSPGAWELVGTVGETDTVRGNNEVNINHLMTGIRPDTGQPLSAFKGDGEGLDQFFTLLGNQTESHIELTDTNSVGRVRTQSLSDNFAAAVQSTAPANPVRVAMPVTANSPTTTLQRGWSLVTATGSTVPSDVTMIIKAGNGEEADVWTSGEDVPSWLTSGSQVFVYAESRVRNFGFFTGSTSSSN